MNKGHLAENWELIKKHVTEWAGKYDLSIPQNREAVGDWIKVAQDLGDLDFATFLEGVLKGS